MTAVRIRGTAPAVGSGDRVFAVARFAAKALAHRWYASDSVRPDSSGRWHATIIVEPPSRAEVLVSALLAPRTLGPQASAAAKKARARARAQRRRRHTSGSSSGPPGPVHTTPVAPPAATSSVEAHGPQAQGVLKRSEPVAVSGAG